MDKLIEYYEFPNGEIVKRIQSDSVYRFNPSNKAWEIDYTLTSEFAWNRPYGEPCKNLRQKVDITCDLPPFPCENEFYTGNTVMLGAYPQKSRHDFSPIPWIVLETTDSTALCISKDCLITSGYCDPHAYEKPQLLWWENSMARTMCNDHFFETAFSEIEKAKIIPTKVNDVKNGKQCVDSVFLLSEREVLQYLQNNSQRKAMPTPYAILTGARQGWTDDTKAYTSWWILPEEYGYQNEAIYPKAVFQTGDIQFHSRNVCHMDFTIRPCIQIQYKQN